MGALAEQWESGELWQHVAGGRPRPRLSLTGVDEVATSQERVLAPPAGGTPAPAPATIATSDSASSDGASSRASWNVLAEELVEYPPAPQRIWLERCEGPDDAARSAAYANAWLEQELEQLRERRRVALGSRKPGAGHGVPRTRAGVPRTRAGAPRARAAAEPIRRHDRAARTPHDHHLVAVPSRGRTAIFGPRGLRRLLPGAATLAVLAGAWFGVGAIASAAHHVQIHTLPGSVPAGREMSYVVRPGETLWSIALRVEPGADPRPLVAELESQLHGKMLQPGDRLLLPR